MTTKYQIQKKSLFEYIKCCLGHHDLKGNLTHSIYRCQRCGAVILYKDSKIKLLN